MPSSAFDTFFACTILVAAALIATAFLGTTLQAQIEGTDDINKDSYLKAIADRIVASPGSPADWGSSQTVPADFGLAASNSVGSYTLDIDKISRLNSLNNYSLSHFEMATAAKLERIAFAVSFSQILAISLTQTSNSTNAGVTEVSFDVLATVDLKPVAAEISGYLIAPNYLGSFNASVESGTGHLTISYPSDLNGPVMVVFARANFDSRVTSYAIYNLANSTQEFTPNTDVLALYPHDYTLHYSSLQEVNVQQAYVLSYQYEQPLSTSEVAQYEIPRLLDSSPFVLVVSGESGGGSFVDWTAYPQVPLEAGSSFHGSERNIYSYMVTINGVLYKMDISLGDVAP